MPFTPFHLGPALLFGLVLSMAFDLPTFLMPNVILDVGPLIVLWFSIYGYPLHGFFHSYQGSAFLAVTLAVFVYPIRGTINKIIRILEFHRDRPSAMVWARARGLIALLGVATYVHKIRKGVAVLN